MDKENAVAALRCGEERALTWLIDRYAAYVGTIIYNIIGGVMSAPDIEEVASDVFLALWENAEKVRTNTVRAYLGGIARNKAKNKLRELGRDLPLDEDLLLVSAQTPEGILEERELRTLVSSAVLSLGPPDREIFLRHYYHCQTVAVIAAELDMNVSTVKTRLRRGRERLKDILEQGGAR
ncbi:MAG: sigma-70 family RNA polymerase sigma factor [Oscillospiraceae bacterium]|jgi:RNA polymerase sigma-70 factor (ECF subfamily)|nr:sigma-70 family RNA polymerase sigma factor [Oscillospiraceae bacterium]